MRCSERKLVTFTKQRMIGGYHDNEPTPPFSEFPTKLPLLQQTAVLSGL
ncbi:rCG62975 [Rattus norvegicus]|uniref:RCG62975 n=1 Tax=Rattus norvegicus TaxID=10116 RepID=A6HNU6_RAT|nr:rCG62975 [Rattus norvegicus]